MKNAEVLRMAAALLTPADETDTSSSSSSSSSTPTVTATALTTTPVATVTTVKVAVKDPMVAERLRLLLETAVRMLYSKGLLSGEALPAPIYPLASDGEFPLPDSLASVAACYAAWLFTGEDRLKTAWEVGLDAYLASLEAVISPIVKRV